MRRRQRWVGGGRPVSRRLATRRRRDEPARVCGPSGGGPARPAMRRSDDRPRRDQGRAPAPVVVDGTVDGNPGRVPRGTRRAGRDGARPAHRRGRRPRAERWPARLAPAAGRRRRPRRVRGRAGRRAPHRQDDPGVAARASWLAVPRRCRHVRAAGAAVRGRSVLAAVHPRRSAGGDRRAGLRRPRGDPGVAARPARRADGAGRDRRRPWARGAGRRWSASARRRRSAPSPRTSRECRTDAPRSTGSPRSLQRCPRGHCPSPIPAAVAALDDVAAVATAARAR